MKTSEKPEEIETRRRKAIVRAVSYFNEFLDTKPNLSDERLGKEAIIISSRLILRLCALDLQKKYGEHIYVKEQVDAMLVEILNPFTYTEENDNIKELSVSIDQITDALHAEHAPPPERLAAFMKTRQSIGKKPKRKIQ